jgi:lipopolysaccharide export system protein LptC
MMSSPIRASAARALRFAALSRALSWLALAIGVGFAVLFVGQAGLFDALLPRTGPAGPEDPVTEQITASDSTVNGLDRENQPYQLKAKHGRQDETVPQLVHLEIIEGQFRRAAGTVYTLNADTGTYDTRVKELDLKGNVVIREAERFTAVMERAHVVVEEKKLVSDAPVIVSLKNGSIAANGIEIGNDGSRILFLNGVKARFGGTDKKGDGNP